MFILIGLGNPGKKYAQNRHNVGFMFVDWVQVRQADESVWKHDKYADADIAKTTLTFGTDTIQTTLAKPRTFMNRSGFTANKLLTFENLLPTALIIAHDDLDISLGEFKIQKVKGPKVHNGLASIESSLRFKDFWRIRIGIDNRDPARRIPGEPYVLQNFASEEMNTVTGLFPIIFQKLQQVFEAQEQS